MPTPVSRLAIFEEDQGNFGTVVTLLIDGVDVLAGDDNHFGGIGWRRDVVLIRDCPLLPGGEPRRVALYRCTCGNWEDGDVTALIFERDGLVHWTDIRSMGGWFTGPSSLAPAVVEANVTEPVYVARHSQPPLGFPDLVFDSAQYRAEVDRALRAPRSS